MIATGRYPRMQPLSFVELRCSLLKELLQDGRSIVLERPGRGGLSHKESGSKLKIQEKIGWNCEDGH